MDESSENPWGGWLMADLALLLVFLFMATATPANTATKEPSPTPMEITTTSPVQPSKTSSPAPGLDPREVDIQVIVKGRDNKSLQTAANELVNQIKEKSEGRRPGLIMLFGTAFEDDEEASRGGKELAEKIIKLMDTMFGYNIPVMKAFHQLDTPHGTVLGTVYYFDE